MKKKSVGWYPIETTQRSSVLPLTVLQVVNYSESRTAEEICESSSKMITFIDLAGHHKYLKTTIFGLTSYCPDFAMLVVSANTGIGELRRQLTGCQSSSNSFC